LNCAPKVGHKEKGYEKERKLSQVCPGNEANGCRELHADVAAIKRMRELYLKGGELALLSPMYSPQMTAEKKEEILLAIKEKGLSLYAAAIKYGIPEATLGRWKRAYEQFGIAGLDRKRSGNTMKKKRQRTEAELDELEMLRKRNEYLEAENALLKKVKALVEEREARLRAIGRGPSKN